MRTRSPRKPAGGPLGVPVVGHALLTLPIDPAVAKRDFLRGLPMGIPLRPPIVLRVTLIFAAPGSLAGACADRPGWHVGNPSLFERQPAITDALIRRGYVAFPSDVSCWLVAKRWGSTPGVRLYLRTLLDPEDAGLELPITETGAVCPFHVTPPVVADLGERPLPFQPQRVAPPRGKSKEVVHAASHSTHPQK